MSSTKLSPQTEQFIKSLGLWKDFGVCVDPDWGSKYESGRSLLHQDLDQRSSHAKDLIFQSSISHTIDLGGYFWTLGSLNMPIGFDVELAARVLPNLAQRVSQETEFKQAPSPAHLWCAKESAFKALRGPAQPKVIGSITISDWRTLDHFETFCFRTGPPEAPVIGGGLTFTEKVFQFALAWLPQNFGA